jgi:hypothetical protein
MSSVHHVYSDLEAALESVPRGYEIHTLCQSEAGWHCRLKLPNDLYAWGDGALPAIAVRKATDHAEKQNIWEPRLLLDARANVIRARNSLTELLNEI